MGHQDFVDDNMTLALTLAGTARLLAERIVKRDIAITAKVTGQKDDDGYALPAIIIWPGDGQPERNYFPIVGDTNQPGLYAAIWQVFLPYDRMDGWQDRWEAVNEAVRAALLAPGALVTNVRYGPADVRWGEEPPLFLEDTAVPEGMELFYTVVMREV